MTVRAKSMLHFQRHASRARTVNRLLRFFWFLLTCVNAKFALNQEERSNRMTVWAIPAVALRSARVHLPKPSTTNHGDSHEHTRRLHTNQKASPRPAIRHEDATEAQSVAAILYSNQLHELGI